MDIYEVIDHKDRVGGLVWHPEATLSQSRETLNLASSDAEGSIALWSLDR